MVTQHCLVDSASKFMIRVEIPSGFKYTYLYLLFTLFLICVLGLSF